MLQGSRAAVINMFAHTASCSSGGKGMEQARNIEHWFLSSGPERSRGQATSISRVILAAVGRASKISNGRVTVEHSGARNRREYVQPFLFRLPFSSHFLFFPLFLSSFFFFFFFLLVLRDNDTTHVSLPWQ